MLKIYLKEKNETDALAYQQVVVLVIAVSRESNLLKGKSNICTEKLISHISSPGRDNLKFRSPLSSEAPSVVLRSEFQDLNLK